MPLRTRVGPETSFGASLVTAAETIGVDWNKLQKIKAKELQADFDDRFARAKERRAKLAGKAKPKGKAKVAK